MARRALSVRISDEARAAIEDYCLAHGISLTAWVEALGQRVATLRAADDASPELRAIADETVQIARRIDKERRSRA